MKDKTREKASLPTILVLTMSPISKFWIGMMPLPATSTVLEAEKQASFFVPSESVEVTVVSNPGLLLGRKVGTLSPGLPLGIALGWADSESSVGLVGPVPGVPLGLKLGASLAISSDSSVGLVGPVPGVPLGLKLGTSLGITLGMPLGLALGYMLGCELGEAACATDSLRTTIQAFRSDLGFGASCI
jgi:hypothetical protein